MKVSTINSSNRPTVLYNSWSKFALNVLVARLNQPEVSTLKTGITNSLLILLCRSKDTRKTKHTRNVFWVAIAQFSHFSTQEKVLSPFHFMTGFAYGNPVINFSRNVCRKMKGPLETMFYSNARKTRTANKRYKCSRNIRPILNFELQSNLIIKILQNYLIFLTTLKRANFLPLVHCSPASKLPKLLLCIGCQSEYANKIPRKFRFWYIISGLYVKSLLY